MTDQKTIQTLLLIPLYNHGATIREVVTKALATGYSVLVVDDGSDDGGLQKISDLSCDTIRLEENRGKGVAIQVGARYASEHGYSAILTIDADGQHDPSEAEKIIENANQGFWPAIVIGAREMVQDTVPESSHFGKKFSNFWVRLETGKYLEDTQSGMRLYPVKEFLELSFTKSRYDFEIEVLVKSIWAGIDARSVSVSVHYPEKGKRVSHFHKFFDNLRLSMLHTSLVTRRLLPIPHKQLVPVEKQEREQVVVKNPWKTLKNLIRESASPFWLAVAVWFGLFLGALPLLACHTVVIIYVAYRFQLNKIAAVAASQFCMPPIVPALCIEVGYFLQTGEFLLDLSYERWLLEVHYRLWDWFLGSLIVGPLLGLIGGVIVYWLSVKLTNRNGCSA